MCAHQNRVCPLGLDKGGGFRYPRFHAEDSTKALPEIGTRPPPFTLPDQDGRPVRLADHEGRRVLVWFFARAFGSN